MTDFEIFSIILEIINLLVTSGLFLVTLLSYSGKENRKR